MDPFQCPQSRLCTQREHAGRRHVRHTHQSMDRSPDLWGVCGSCGLHVFQEAKHLSGTVLESSRTELGSGAVAVGIHVFQEAKHLLRLVLGRAGAVDLWDTCVPRSETASSLSKAKPINSDTDFSCQVSGQGCCITGLFNMRHSMNCFEALVLKGFSQCPRPEMFRVAHVQILL